MQDPRPAPILCLYCGEWFVLPIFAVIMPPVGCCDDYLCHYQANLWAPEKHETATMALYAEVG